MHNFKTYNIKVGDPFFIVRQDNNPQTQESFPNRQNLLLREILHQKALASPLQKAICKTRVGPRQDSESGISVSYDSGNTS